MTDPVLAARIDTLNDGAGDEGYCSFFVRALFDYEPEGSNMLKFRAGNIIEVLSQLENGWWDGLLDESTRGWFPSNYVELISDEQAERALQSAPRVESPVPGKASVQSTTPHLRPLAQSISDRLNMLLELISYEHSVTPNNVGNHALADYFLQMTKLVVDDVRRFLSSNDMLQIIEFDPSSPKNTRDSSLVLLHLQAQKLPSLLSMLVVQMRELTKLVHCHVNQGDQSEYIRQAYRTEEQEARKNALQLMDTVQILEAGINKNFSHWRNSNGSSTTLARQSAPLVKGSGLVSKKPEQLTLTLTPEVHAFLAEDVMPRPQSALRSLPGTDLDSCIRSKYHDFHRVLKVLHATLRSGDKQVSSPAFWLPAVRDVLEQTGSMLILFDTIEVAAPLDCMRYSDPDDRFPNGLNVSENNDYRQYMSAKERLSSSTKDLFRTVKRALDLNGTDRYEMLDEVAQKTRVLQSDAEDVLQAIRRCLLHVHNRPNILDAKSESSITSSMARMRFSNPISLNQSSTDADPSTRKDTTEDGSIRQSVFETSSIASSQVIYANDLVFTQNGNIKGGTLDALVIALTDQQMTDEKFCAAFLATYLSFTTSEHLLELLIERYRLHQPSVLDAPAPTDADPTLNELIQSRVLIVLRTWLDAYFDPSERNCLNALDQFVRTEVTRAAFRNERQQLLRLIGRQSLGFEKPVPAFQLMGAVPVPILPSNLKEAQFMDIHALELARQLTLMESELFMKIKTTECIKKGWTNSSQHKYRGILNTVDLHNKVWDEMLTSDYVLGRRNVTRGGQQSTTFPKDGAFYNNC